ncbi:unnamed protein product [Acanthoscelides obtectus]|uniref:Uncharacterized protein n=1 Tax=Acanthoscelides obtectus TaxID=200917 RepID=A0A9P0PCB7_ACAOB|nr:unnamed protein product [Acanthoscelides obtectus]CAK1682129.1 hypothetical protein AOBTE_LOCUS33449 [Acanthoscelides obtectus]
MRWKILRPASKSATGLFTYVSVRLASGDRRLGLRTASQTCTPSACIYTCGSVRRVRLSDRSAGHARM